MTKIKLKNVRLSFPSLFQKAVFNGNETKYEATFLINKEENADTIRLIQSEIARMIKEDMKGSKLSSDKICMKDGDTIEYDGYQGCFSLKASNRKKPLVIDKDGTALTEDDDKIIAGCYVNASIELWAQVNDFGKRINANLLGVQFHDAGEPFGDSSKATLDDFDIVKSNDSEDLFG